MHRCNTRLGFGAEPATVTRFGRHDYVVKEFEVRRVRPIEPEWKGITMHRIALALLSTTLLSGIAAAADLRAPVRGPAYSSPPPSYATWTGCYVGISGGGAWGRASSISNGTNNGVS